LYEKTQINEKEAGNGPFKKSFKIKLFMKLQVSFAMNFQFKFYRRIRSHENRIFCQAFLLHFPPIRINWSDHVTILNHLGHFDVSVGSGLAAPLKLVTTKTLPDAREGIPRPLKIKPDHIPKNQKPKKFLKYKTLNKIFGKYPLLIL